MRFVHSSKGIGGEAMNGDPTTAAVIPRVDPMKLKSSAG
jgi:hypothetical protein